MKSAWIWQLISLCFGSKVFGSLLFLLQLIDFPSVNGHSRNDFLLPCSLAPVKENSNKKSSSYLSLKLLDFLTKDLYFPEQIENLTATLTLFNVVGGLVITFQLYYT